MMMASVWGWNNHLVSYGDSDLNYLLGLRVQSVASELGSLSPMKGIVFTLTPLIPV